MAGRPHRVLAAAVLAGTFIAFVPVPAAMAGHVDEATDSGARRPSRAVKARIVLDPPSYYARPRHYRPYPYAVPAPFVFGFGPW